MADPVSLLREYNISKKEIIEKNNEIILGEYLFPKTTKTNYQIHGSGRNGEPKDYYTLESLLFLLKHSDELHPRYVDEAKREGIPHVKRPDRRKLLTYLTGDIGTSDRIGGNTSTEAPVTGKALVAKEQCQQSQDPLTLLREYTVNLKLGEIEEKDNQIIFGEHSFPKTSKTNYLVWQSGRNGVPKDYYSLESLLFLLKHADQRHPIYVDEAKRESIPYIRRPDRKKLLAYLTGEIDTSDSIDGDTSTEAPKAETNDAPNKHKQQDQDPIVKKPKLKETILVHKPVTSSVFKNFNFILAVHNYRGDCVQVIYLNSGIYFIFHTGILVFLIVKLIK